MCSSLESLQTAETTHGAGFEIRHISHCFLCYLKNSTKCRLLIYTITRYNIFILNLLCYTFWYYSINTFVIFFLIANVTVLCIYYIIKSIFIWTHPERWDKNKLVPDLSTAKSEPSPPPPSPHPLAQNDVRHIWKVILVKITIKWHIVRGAGGGGYTVYI